MYTTRLVLSPFAQSDSPELLALFRDPHVRRYLLDDVIVDEAWIYAEIQASKERFERGGLGLFAGRLKTNGTLIGFAGLRPFSEPKETQLIYGVLPTFLGQGLATEMTRAVIDAAFLRCGFPLLHAATDIPNDVSARVLSRLEFESVGRAPGLRHEQLRFMLPRSRYKPRIRSVRTTDRAAVRGLHTAAFGRSAEADLVEALEAGGFVVASLVATLGDEPVGHILFTELPLLGIGESRPVRGVALAPVAVRPDVQRRGLGAALIEAGLVACRDQGAAAAVVLGHAAYYSRFGFSAQLATSIQAPWSGPSFMALELVPNALDSGMRTAVYAPPFLGPGEISQGNGSAH